MGTELVIWKRRRGSGLSEGLCYSMLSAGLECDGLVRIDEEALAKAVDSRGRELSLDLEVYPQGVEVAILGRTTEEDLEWLEARVDELGLELVAADSIEISGADQHEVERRLRAVRDEESARLARAEVPEVVGDAERGDLEAIVRLGVMLSLGEGVDIDHSRAFRLFERAARAGNPDGMFNLASCYQRGEGVERDRGAAVRWYRTAADAGELFAPFALGEMYANGDGVPRNRQRAVEWFFVAERRGVPEARSKLRELGALPPLPDPD